MQFTAFGLLALASLATAQSSAIPACAQPCVADAVKASTTCGVSDTACQCLPDNVSKIQTAATSCVIGKCGITVALTIPAAANAACAALPAPSSAAPTYASSAAAPSSSSIAPSSTAESSAASSPASAPAPSYASTPVSSVLVTSGVASPTGGTGSNTTRPTTPATPASPTTPATSSVPYTGAGAQVKAGAGSALVLGIAAIFAL
ncbi:hypothetical protein DSL72_008076 [Monilinia vaccinii-corymbosi]|uniref:CFEM domain-containing protein n=1 Tax=Monilinia vaccinii-corymbosi TaxID=61207 RepID=A0A8A3PJN6_9HELO|nr:hypothetical protein DSL72_008076 [Monilinia vaccinii-corymbosi]